MSHKNLIGERIAELRKKNNESQEDLAHAIHCGQSTISKLENGHQRLSPDMQLELTEHYKLPPNYFYSGVGNNILDILTNYIKLEYVPTKDGNANYPLLKINAPLINYLITVDTIKTLSYKFDSLNVLLNEQKDIFYNSANEPSIKELCIPLTKEFIFPDEYRKEWGKFINLKNILPCDTSQNED